MITSDAKKRALKQLDRRRRSSRSWANVIRVRIALSFAISIFTVWINLPHVIMSYEGLDPHQREKDVFMREVILSGDSLGGSPSPREVQKIEERLAEARTEDAQEAFVRKGAMVDGIASAVVLLAMIVALIWAIRRNNKESVRISRQEFSKQELALRSVQGLHSTIARLASAAGLPQQSFRTVIDKSRDDGFPSVRKIGDKATLVVPLGFLGFMTKHPGASEAVLAHELAHITSDDSSLFFLSDLFIRTVMAIQFPFACLSAAAAFVAWQSIAETQKTNAVNAIVGPILILAFYYSVRNIRRRSESVADLAAAIQVGPESIIEAISHLPRAPFFFPRHEQPRRRVKQVKKFARRYLNAQ